MFYSKLYKFIFLCVLLAPLGFAQAHEAAPKQTNEYVGISWPINPILPAGDGPVYVYQCSDITCDDPWQLDYVTPVPPQYSFPTPSPITFYKTDGQTIFLEFFQKDKGIPVGGWKSCRVGIESDGTIIEPSVNDEKCRGVVNTENSTPSVTMISLNGVWFTHSNSLAPPSPNETVKLPSRSLTFVNNTDYSEICLNTATKFKPKETGCKHEGDHIVKKGESLVIQIPPEGYKAGALFFTGFLDSSGQWVNTGQKTGQQPYATKMEWTIFPTEPYNPPRSQQKSNADHPIVTNHSIGMTNMDLSAVDGYNIATTLKTSTGAICATARWDSNGKPLPSLYVYTPPDGALSQIPKSGYTLESLCPTPAPNETLPYKVTDNTTDDFLGCMSECTYQQELKKDSDGALWACCIKPAYPDSKACTEAKSPSGYPYGEIYHKDLPYVKNVEQGSTRVYSWSYDDMNGDYSCDPAASFVFTLGSTSPIPPLNPPTGLSVKVSGQFGFFTLSFNHATGGTPPYSYKVHVTDITTHNAWTVPTTEDHNIIIWGIMRLNNYEVIVEANDQKGNNAYSIPYEFHVPN